jgi:hypothetical protein
MALISGLMLATSAAASAHLIRPFGMVIPINSYYGTMLQQSQWDPFRVDHVEVTAHRLERSGPCVYNSSGIELGNASATLDTPRGETDTFCPPTRGARTPRPEFTPRTKLISNPSMDFQPLLNKLGTQAAISVGLAAANYGTPTHITIHLNRAKHTGEAVVFYKRNPAASGTKQVKALTFVAGAHGETVGKAWY